MFYYKNIGENEVPECNRGGNSLKQNPRISSVPRRTSSSVSFHVWTVPGACPTKHRQWADFLVPLVAPLHRQYKTARTETRYHLLLKTRQMITQTSASRGYVVFSGANKGHTQKSLNCLRFADTPRGMFQTWKNTELDVRRGMVRNTGFCA